MAVGNLLQTGTFKRKDIYSFLGGLFIACSWYLHFNKTDLLLIGSGSILSIELFFALGWLFSTALLFVFQLGMTFVITKLLLSRLKKKRLEVLQTISGLKDPIRNFIFHDQFENLLSNSHITSVISLSLLISSYPLMKVIQSYFGIKISCILVFPIFIICTLLFYFYFIVYRQYLVLLQLRLLGRLDFIDKKKYCEELATFSAKRSLQLKNNENAPPEH